MATLTNRPRPLNPLGDLDDSEESVYRLQSVIVKIACETPIPVRARTPNVTHFRTIGSAFLWALPKRLSGFSERGRPRPLRDSLSRYREGRSRYVDKVPIH